MNDEVFHSCVEESDPQIVATRLLGCLTVQDTMLYVRCAVGTVAPFMLLTGQRCKYMAAECSGTGAVLEVSLSFDNCS